MNLYLTSSGKKIRLGSQKNAGGEGAVWEVIGRGDLLAKTYHKGCSPEMEVKLIAMLDRPPLQPRGHLSVAWPKTLLYEKSSCVGFIMPYMRGNATTIFNFEHPAARKKRFPTCNRRDIYQMGINLSSAVELIHHVGHVIGDLNEANILAGPSGLITLIDTDSFQINDGHGHIHRCGVGVDNLIAPEIQGQRRGEFVWKVEHDRFALAVHLFYLLVGSHPFNGVLRSGEQVNSVDVYLIQAGIFPFRANTVAEPPPKGVPHYERLSPSLRIAFEHTFVDGNADPSKRLTAEQWRLLLVDMKEPLRRCRQCRAFNEPQLKDCFECCARLPIKTVGGQIPTNRWQQRLVDWWWEYSRQATVGLTTIGIVGVVALSYYVESSSRRKSDSDSLSIRSTPSERIMPAQTQETANLKPVTHTVVIHDTDRDSTWEEILLAAENLYTKRKHYLAAERNNAYAESVIDKAEKEIIRVNDNRSSSDNKATSQVYDDRVRECQNRINWYSQNKQNLDATSGYVDYIRALDSLKSSEQIKDARTPNDLQQKLVGLVKSHAQLKLESRFPTDATIIASFDNLAEQDFAVEKMAASIK